MSHVKKILSTGCLIAFCAMSGICSDKKNTESKPANSSTTLNVDKSKIDSYVRNFIINGITKRYPSIKIVDMKLVSKETTAGGAGELTRYRINVILETITSPKADSLPHCFQPIMATTSESVSLIIGAKAEAFVIVDKESMGKKYSLNFSGYWTAADN